MLAGLSSTVLTAQVQVREISILMEFQCECEPLVMMQITLSREYVVCLEDPDILPRFLLVNKSRPAQN